MKTQKNLPVEAARKTLRRIGTFAAIAIAIAGCNDVLEVQNPGAIQEGQLGDAALAQLIVNGAIGEFQHAYGIYAEWNSAI